MEKAHDEPTPAPQAEASEEVAPAADAVEETDGPTPEEEAEREAKVLSFASTTHYHFVYGLAFASDCRHHNADKDGCLCCNGTHALLNSKVAG